MKDHLVYCRTDYEIIFQGEYLQSLSPEQGGQGIPYYNGVGAVQKGRPRKRKNSCQDMEGCQSMGKSKLCVYTFVVCVVIFRFSAEYGLSVYQCCL